MKSGVICLLVLGLANISNVWGLGAELGLEGVSTQELKEIEKEIAKGNVPPNYQGSDKPKRGVAKLTSSDNPGFNHIANAAANTKAAVAPAAAPVRYVYNPYSYVPYVPQAPQAAQIAAQYAFQPPGVTHYLQTPTQIQYVSSPSIQQVPSPKYQQLMSKFPVPAASPYLLTAPQSFIPQQYVTSAAAPGAAAASTAGEAGKVAAQSGAAAATSAYPGASAQSLYYPQQPILMLLVNPQPHPMFYQNQHAHQMQLLLGQHPFLGLYGGHRFGLPYHPQANQVTYLVPMNLGQAPQAIQTQQQVQQTTGQTVSSEKGSETAASTTFGLRTKA